MKTLFVSDLDGTLLNRQDQLSDYTKNTLNRLIGQGMVFTYATARSLSSSSIVADGLTTKLPVIVYNGAYILNASTRQVLHSCTFTAGQKQFIAALLRRHQISPLVYAFREGAERVSWLSGQETEGMQHYLNNRRDDPRMNPLNSLEQLYQGDAFYFTCIGDQAALLPVYQALKNHPEYNCILQQELYREEYWCEIMPSQATKANAIHRLKALLNCDRVISFGDAVNDIPMFRISDECYAVENAVPQLKAIATGILPSNEENGVARWLAEHWREDKHPCI